LHTTVIGPRSQRVELQIRTHEMDQVAEYGIAAHALYKDDGSGRSRPEQRLSDSRAFSWLRRTVELLDSDEGAEDFLENTKLELFQDQVFCFTPKGRVIALPRGATSIDFAYAVHTVVGDTCVGCKINGRLMPLFTPLQNGDEVEVITSPAQVPSPAWEQIAVTGKARGAIRRATKLAVRRQYAGLGKQVLERAFKRMEIKLDETQLEMMAGRLAHKTLEDIYAAVGRGELSSEDVLKAVSPEDDGHRRTGPAPDSADGWFGLKKSSSLQFRFPGFRKKGEANGKALPIRGLKGDMPIRFAPEGGAIPGDRIVGILTPGEGITVYPIHSPQLSQFDGTPERWLDVRWDVDIGDQQRFAATIDVTAINEPGTLATIASMIAENRANVDTLQMTRRSGDFTDMRIELEVSDVKHLNRILAQLRSSSVVSAADRYTG
ncbi:MAG: bifunctional (p)ppGpp synthetase/guanosine-3',5'-bis(diphosphate) 3'-pyrophosphohydrolase, partial [Hyphomicrobiaceae bacterium]|nr:bifunctional (p)ppGpp synthetase/guanosine-3',5'-bis(diphosphate) 3'-pyrophosphohydrolase [Hyphomicrobiaceae bacterium]